MTLSSRYEKQNRPRKSGRGRFGSVKDDLYDPMTGALYVAYRNRDGSVDYWNTSSLRWYYGIKKRDGGQDLYEPRGGRRIFGFRNRRGTTDYLDPPTGRWVWAPRPARR